MAASSHDETCIRATRRADVDALLGLYRRVAARPGGLARLAQEIDRPWVEAFVDATLAGGVGFVVEDADAGLVGEIHGWVNPPAAFAHVLANLTVAVDPAAQGRGVGRRLFGHFVEHVRDEHPAILRIELVARESNARAIVLYESLGFVREGRMERRIRGHDGALEADIPMAWLRSLAP